ncbi:MULTISPECIES: tyrosinase family oxidase copper chaperone [Streptomyces]|uniref:tyrosinase family oxidase copper chaperone n=1 Tax=Streptomyces TaxID=1883 RepID=UPI0004BDF262|nr:MULTISPECIES: tyrosinase family oxidase copper chaperone [Streptomyces]MYR73786.1 tyrosinase [Streptomyces sp. SID4925]SBV03012.1 Tyrosinase co-factor MelC1 [Streptomyces sp. OspMP-M45]
MDPTTATPGPAVPAGTTPAAGPPAPAPHRPARRAVLRTAFTTTLVAGTAGALAPVLLKDPGTPDRGARRSQAPERFSETYRGRHIRGTATAVVPAGVHPGAAAASTTTAADVTIDGRPLHVMRRADGSYLSEVNHYESFPTLLETARAAVDELGTARLAPTTPHTI